MLQNLPYFWNTKKFFLEIFLGTNIEQDLDNVMPKLLLSQLLVFMTVLLFAKIMKFHGKVPVIPWILTDPLLTKLVNFAKMKGKNLLKLITRLKTIWFLNYSYIVNILLDFWAMYGLEERHKVMEEEEHQLCFGLPVQILLVVNIDFTKKNVNLFLEINFMIFFNICRV